MATRFPDIEHCIVCEGVRLEAYGKHTLLGYYGLAPRIRISIAHFSAPVTLCFVFMGGPGEGELSATVRLTSPSKQTFEASPATGSFKPGATSAGFYMLISAKLPGAGKYQVELVSSGVVKYQTEIELIHATPAEMAALKGP